MRGVRSARSDPGRRDGAHPPEGQDRHRPDPRHPGARQARDDRAPDEPRGAGGRGLAVHPHRADHERRVGHRHRPPAQGRRGAAHRGQERLEKSLGVLALRHKDTLTIGRTHGVHAEPTSFGLKVAVWYAEAGRNLERSVERARRSPSASSRAPWATCPRRARARGRGVSCAGARGGARLDADRAARPPRRALGDAGGGRGLAREDRPRGPGTPAHGDSGGPRTLRRGAEGLERDAAQAIRSWPSASAVWHG